jgi:hypothetical protein
VGGLPHGRKVAKSRVFCRFCPAAAGSRSTSAALRVQIDADGEVIRLRNGSVRAHPAIRDELGCRAQVMRAIEKLGLNFEAVKAIGRPPGSFNR